MTREEFEKNIYLGLRNATLERLLEVFNQEETSFVAAVKYKLDRTLIKLQKLQEMVDVPVKCIQLSLMRYSILKGTPLIRIDIYGELGVLSDAILTDEMKVSWLATGLEELRENLLLKAEENDEVHLGDIDVWMSKTVDWIMHIFKEKLRYHWKLAEELERLNCIKKAKDFYISVGEYMDKQEYMYVDRAPIDIFFNVEKETLIYRKYVDVIYLNKRFQNLELEGARFINCSFQSSEFQNCSLIDCTFENCNMKKILFDNCDMRGCEFVGCTFQKVDHIKMDGNAYSGYKNIVCRFLRYEGCDMKQLTYKECDLSYAEIKESDMKQVVIDKESIVEKSDFIEFVTNGEEENASV